jgi:exosortase
LIATWLLYHQIADHLMGQWLSDSDYNYGFLVPLPAAAVIWKERARLRELTPAPSWAGLVVVLGALALLVVGVLGAENFLQRSSLLFLLAGLVIQFRGWKYFRFVLFPWLTLFLMIPLPALVYNQIALPLQFFASRLGAALLGLAGLPGAMCGQCDHFAFGHFRGGRSLQRFAFVVLSDHSVGVLCLFL